MTEVETKAQERAERMKAWFAEMKVPKEVNLNCHGNIFDTKLYIETAIATINHSIINSNPFRASYMNLYREALVLDWAEEKGILTNGTKLKQGLKTLEEVQEMLCAIHDNDFDELQDAIGDVLVTVIIQAEMNGTNIATCLAKAYDVISKRTGKMQNGTFIKNVII